MYKQQVIYGEIRASAKKKTAVAQVRLRISSAHSFAVNLRPLTQYFRSTLQRTIVLSAFAPIQCLRFKTASVVRGGGPTAQAYALRLAVVKCMLALGEQIDYVYRSNNVIANDARIVERKKYGHAKARRSFQFSKR
ncbi:MAG: uS9 family ribosomal protein [Candidatus Hodgkinia cicadicola]